MVKQLTSVTTFKTEVGDVLGLTYSEINQDGDFVKRNQKVMKVVMDDDTKAHVEALREHAQSLLDEMEG